MGPFLQMHLPLNCMIMRDMTHATAIPVDAQREYYQRIFEALGDGGRVLVCCKNGVHRSPAVCFQNRSLSARIRIESDRPRVGVVARACSRI